MSVARMNAEIQNNLIVCPWHGIKISRPPGPVGKYKDDVENNMDNDVGYMPISFGGGRRNIDLRIE